MTNKGNLDEEKLVSVLNREINRELSKSMEEIDMDLVDECMAFLDEIDGDKYKPDEREKQRRLAELSLMISEKCKPKTSAAKKSRIGWKNTLIAAACMLILMSASVFVCAAVWHTTPDDVLIKWGKAIFSLPYDEEINEDGFTFIFPGDTKKYSSLTEFAESEQFHILLPEWLPDNTKVESVIYTKASENENINFQFNDENLFYYIKLNQTIQYDTWDALEQGSFNDITYCVLESEYGFEVCFNYENNSYSIIYSDISTVITILENLKETEVNS